MATILPTLLLLLAQDGAPDRVSLRVSRFPGKGKPLVLEGKTSIPEGTRIFVKLHSISDRLVGADGRLEAALGPARGEARVEVRKGRLKLIYPGVFPGIYRVVIRRYEPPQEILAEQEIFVWPGSLPDQLESRLSEIDDLTAPSLRTLKTLDAARTRQEAFGRLEEVVALDRKITKLKQRPFLSQSRRKLGEGIGELAGLVRELKWDQENGKLELDTYYKEKREAFSISVHLGAVEAVEELAGREFCLWLIRDFRRTMTLSPDGRRVLRKHRDHRGVAGFADRLEKLSPETVDELEREIRRIPAPR